MAGPWEKYQQQPAIDQAQPEQAGPWAKYQAVEPAADAANDVPDEQGGIQALDFAKEAGAGVLSGTGALVGGIGDAVRPDPQARQPVMTPNGEFMPLGDLLGKHAIDPVRGAIADVVEGPAGAVGEWLSSKGKALGESKSAAAKQVLKASTPSGDVTSPSTWSMGEDPSFAGYGLHGANLLGQFVPQAGAMLATRGRAVQTPAMMAVGGLQAGGAAGNEVEERIAATSDLDLLADSPVYRQLREKGLGEKEARQQLTLLARDGAFDGAAPVGALGGAATQFALGPLQRIIGGGIGRRLAYGLAVDAPVEGLQEVAETVAARAGVNDATGEQRSLTADTFADAALGAMGGAGHATLGAALGRPQAAARPVDPDAEADATFENTPEPAALPAPGLQGLPAPEQTFYADSQGNMQDTGPVRNVDGEMQPDQQGRQWINPRNRADRPVGGEGMEREVARGEPAPMVGQFQHGSRQQVADTAAQRTPDTFDHEPSLGLPAPGRAIPDMRGDNITVAPDGTAVPGKTPNSPPVNYVQGGPGMDQQREVGKTYRGLPAANRAIRESANPEQLEAVKVGPQTFEVRPKAAEPDAPRPVLQNRDRSTPASITQMRSIAARPDYQRVSVSRDFANGAPVVEPGAAVPSSRKGRAEVVSTASGRKIRTQYAVIEASDLLPSHDINGSQNTEYATGAKGKSRAIAGNGRVTGISHAYAQGTASEYRRELEADAAGHGISAKAIKGMKQPVLVRIMPQDQITQDIGDESNTATVSALSAAEQARNDAARIDTASMAFDGNGEISEATVRQFIQSMPEAERGGLLDGGRPSRQAYDRAASAVFASAYESDELIRLQAQATDPEARTVLSGLLAAASKMARLKGQGQWDIRGLVVEAAQAAVNATRNGQTLAAYAEQFDIERNPEATYFIDLFAANSRSGKRIGEQLSAIADTFYAEASKPEFDMFGAVPRRSRQELLGEIDGTAEGQPSSAQPTGQQAGTGTTEASRPAAAVDEGEPAGTGADAQAEAFQLNQQTEEELAAADAANKARIKAEEKAQAEADEKRRKEEERAQIKAQSEAQADNFTLGVSGEDALSGQAGMFDSQPSLSELGSRPAATPKQEAAGEQKPLTLRDAEQLLADAEKADGEDGLLRELTKRRKLPADREMIQEAFASIASFYEDAKGVLGVMAQNAVRKRDGTALKEEILDRWNGDLAGLQLSNAAGTQFAFFLPDATEPGRFRASLFDARGFFGHSTRDSYEQLLDEQFSDGFRVEVTGKLEELAGTDSFAKGNELVSKVQAVNAGQMTWAEFVDQQKAAASVESAPEANSKPASERQPIRFTADQPAGDYLADGSTIEDGSGQQYRVHYQRNDLVVAHPIVDGKAQVNAESSVRFHVGRPESADGRRTDPIYLVKDRSNAGALTDKAAGKPKKQKEKASASIEDAGEKLGGARKDQLRSVRERLDNMDDEAIAGSSLSQLWPKGELDKISDPFEAALYHTVRGYIPAKPRVPYRVKAWVGKVKAARDILTTLGRLGADASAEKMRAFSPDLGIVADQIEVLMALDRKHWGRIDNIRRAHGRYNQDGEMVPGSWVSLNIDGRQVSFYGHDSVASAIPAIKDRVEGKDAPEKRMKFAIYTDRQTSDVFVVKEGDAEMRRLKTFKTVKEARAFLNDEYEAAVALWDAVKNRDNVTKSDMRRATNEPRVGQDHRNGKDVTPEQFIEAFGFRGVEFGNWVKQGAGGRERQGMLNDAYDAFMDLAGILNIPPKALSLEGKLGIGFGSRGSGKASAHYEPDLVVINMTKTKGAGTLAHEWFHALDNYFARRRAEQPGSGIAMTDRETAYITYRPERLWVNKKHPSMRMTRSELSRYQANHPNAPLYAEGNWEPDQNHPKGVRPQVEKAFAELVATLNASPMLQRAKVIDGKTSDGYWSRIIERGARSFETYVIARLADQGFRNDYLANVQTLEQFSRDPGRYPYLTPDEQGPVNEAFDKLFATLETKETDLGVALFSRASGPVDPAGLSESSIVAGKVPENPISLEEAISAAEQFLADYNGNIELSYRIRKKQDELYGPGSIAKIGVVKGAYHPGRGLFTLASDHLSSAADAVETLRHEVLGHYGLDTFSPADKQAVLDKILASKKEPSLKLIWDDIAVRYKDKSQNVQAEEVFAFLAQGERSGKEKLADLLYSLLTRLLRKVLGYKKGIITRSELLREIEVISKGIRNGSRPRKTFDSETGAGAIAVKGAQATEVNEELAESVAQAIAKSPELAGIKVVQSFDDLPLSARIRAKRDGVAPGELRGIYSSGATYVVAGNHASVADALYTAVHEEVGHRGIHGLLGDRLDATMERLYTSQAATTKGRQRIAQIRQAYAKVLEKLDARKQRLMIAEEMVALLIEDGERPTALQRVLSKMRELLRALVPQVSWTYTDILALGEQSRRWLRDNQAGTTDAERTLYALGAKRLHTSEAFSDLTAKQKEALNKIAPRTAKQQAVEWFRQQSDRALLKIRQGIVDRYAALRDLDEAVHGKDVLSTDIASSAWVLARMSSAASGALHAMLNNGRIYLDQQQKVIDIQDGEALGLGATLARLGSAAEIERFMGWIAGNRSAKLAAEGRENLFDAAEIDALRTLNRGTTEHGMARGALYNEVFAEFQQYRDDVLAIAEHAGVITPESRALWRDEFYVPFYRVMDEDAAAGPMASKGLTRQEAYKKLKGGNQNLNDLLQNTLLNFNHLLQASLKNQAAAQAIDNAEQLGIAQPVSEAARDKKASTFVLKAGVKQWYNIGDPLVFEALSSLSDAGLNNAAVRAMSFFKRLFTNMTTITPQFIIANLLRDSMSATATSPVSKNFLKNIAVGGSSWVDARKRARMLASGGAFSFGHIYSNDPDEVKAHLTRNLRSAKLIDGPKLVPQALKAGWDAWNAVANTAENANRAAIFEQNEQGRGKLAAAFEARDLMDFSMHGAWPAVRFLIRVVPFLNARLQGLDKLYRAGVKPSLLTAFGQGSASDKQAAKRFLAVTTALSLASMALMLVNNDDEEYRKLEEWQKDTYWFVRLGGQAFFIPKPFEVGAIATMAERLLQQAIDDKATGKLFAQRLGHTLTQTFSFSLVPHMFQPVLDVYSNVDAFTGRPIESTGMDRLSKGLRTRATTTAPARAVSAVSRVFGDEFPLAVSPIQADHLIAGYLGQVGAWGAGMVDTMWRAANGESQPAKHWHEYQPIRRFYRDLDTPAAYTRYSTIFYEGLREAGKAYADVKELQELGRMDEAREVIREKRDVLGMRKQLNQVQRRLTAINARMDAVRLGELDADAKRRELDRLLVIKGRLTEMAGKRLEDMRAKR